MRTAIRRLAGRAPRLVPDLRVEAMRLGSEYGGWAIAPFAIPPRAIVYSAGVGEDVSFDAALLRVMQLSVLHLIDPTPGVLEHPRISSLRADGCSIHCHAVALTGTDGTVSLWPPNHEGHTSYSEVNATSRSPIDVRSRKLSTLLDQCGDGRIDLLKMDIEGSEYEVIDDLLQSGIRPRQVLVEFHHRFSDIGCQRTEQAVGNLRSAGFRLFAISPTAEEYSFLHESVLVDSSRGHSP